MKTAPERIWLGKPPDDKSWEWHGAWSPQPFSENVNSVEYVRQDIADERVREARREAWGQAMAVADDYRRMAIDDFYGKYRTAVISNALEFARTAAEGG